MPCCRLAGSIRSLAALAMVLLTGASALAQGPTCCDFSGNCYQPGVFGNCGGDTNMGTGVSCSPNPCVGRCCNLTTGACTLGVLGNGFGSANCNPGGYAFGATSCGGSPCPASGACCDGNAGCSVLTATGCGANVYMGNNTTCTAGGCLGACCNVISGACSLTGFQQCPAGTFNNIGSVCTATLCTGACCSQITGACALTGPAGCSGTNTYLGLHSTCSVGACPQPGACCAAVTFACTTKVQSLCQATSGTFIGVGTPCTPSPCAEPAAPFAFTYQGRLTGGPASGTISARFTLWDNLTSASIANRVAGPVTVNGVALNASLFTAVVDFGARVPADRKTWLQVEVNTGPGFVSLNPRQLMTFAPLAGHAAAAGVTGTASQTLRLGPGSFVAKDSLARVQNSFADGVYITTVGTDELVAPINLPDGAKIDLVTAYVNDMVSTDLEFSILAKLNGSTSSTLVGPDFVVSGNTGYSSQTATGGAVIDGTRAYFLRVFPAPGSGQWPGNNTLAVQNVVITWHLP